MSRRSRGAAAVVVAAVVSACAPPPEDDGVTLTLPPTTTESTSTTVPPLAVPATITLSTSGSVKKLVTLDKESVCLDDRKGGLSVYGAAADGTALDVTLSNPASGRFPLGASPASPPGPSATAQGARVTKLSLRLEGREYSRPTSGEISIGDARGRWGTVVAQAFAEEQNLKMTADWICQVPAPAPAPAPGPRPPEPSLPRP